MDLKKSIFSYITWAVLAPFCLLGIVFALERAGITEVSGMSSAAVVGGVCVYLLFAAAVFMALRTICMEIERHIRDIKKLEAICSVLLPVLILTGTCVYLAFHFMHRTPFTPGEDGFYNLALVSDEKNVLYSAHGASWMYTCLLHMMLLIFGNTPFAGIVLQILLFLLSLLFLYIGMKAFAGVFPAAVSMAAFGFLPVTMEYVFSLTPELFFLAVYLLGFCLSGALYGKYRLQGISHPAWYILFFLAGMYIGFSCWLDISGVFLVFFFAPLFSVEGRRKKQAVLANFSVLLGAAGGFFLSVLALSLTKQIDPLGYLTEFASLYLQNTGVTAESVRQGLFLPDITLAGSMVLITFAFFCIPAFFLWKRNQNSVFIVQLFWIYALAMFSVFRLDAQMAVTLGWSMLAGLGLYGAVRLPGEDAAADRDTSGEDEAADQDTSGEDEEKGTKAEEIFADNKKDSSADSVKDISAKRAGENKKSHMDHKANAPDGAVEKKKKEQPAKKQEQEKPAPGAPLHNPLPVPKKKNRPAQDFGYQVEEKDMDFDFDIKEEDDFDW